MHRTAQGWGLSLALFAVAAVAAEGPPQGPSAAPALSPVGTPPPGAQFPRIEFAFEERVTLAPATVVGETPWGNRQYIPITGGTVAGPKLRGEVIPGGWDYQLRLSNGCSALSADYFLRAEDGTVIRVLNEGVLCGQGGERGFFRPKFEAPKGPHEWLSRATFVVTLEIEPPAAPASQGAPPEVRAIRLKFYQVK